MSTNYPIQWVRVTAEIDVFLNEVLFWVNVEVFTFNEKLKKNCDKMTDNDSVLKFDLLFEMLQKISTNENIYKTVKLIQPLPFSSWLYEMTTNCG